MRRTWRIDLLLFLILSVLVIFIQYDLLKPAMEVGLTPDDWSFIFWYKLLGPDPLSKITEVWSVRGPYTTVPLFYTGIINSVVGFDYQKLQIVSIFFKMLATLILVPLVLIVFKNRLLAILTTILFAMSYPSSGALETAVEPSEYLGMFSMGIFLITYYHIIKNGLLNWKWLSLSIILLIITILLSVMRLYPVLVLIPAVEVYLFVQKRSIAALRASFLRVSLLFLPFILITLFRPGVILSYIGVVPTVILRVLEGNWHLALTTLQGLGHTLPISADLWRRFGLLTMSDFSNYSSFILGGPTIIFGLIILLLAFFTSTKPWKFFIITFSLNFILEILLYFIAKHSLNIPANLRVNFDEFRIYPSLFGLFILVLTFIYWIEWKTQGKNNHLLLALWIGPTISFLFIFLTWMLASVNLGFGQSAQDHYLMIPSASMSISIAALLVLTYERSRGIKSRLFQGAITGLIFIVLIIFYLLNRNLTYSYFNHANVNGRAAAGQKLIQARFREKIKDANLRPATLFYFDTSQLSGDGPFYTEGLLSIFPVWMRFQGTQLIDGCSERLYLNEHKQLIPYIKEQNGQRGFFYKGLCVENGKGGYKDIFYTTDNFYAFRIKDKDFIDIKEEVLKELGFTIK